MKSPPPDPLGMSKEVNVRKTHPNLYKMIRACNLTFVALGINFFFFVPPFNPFGIPYTITAAVFFTIGVVKQVVLQFTHRWQLIRWLMTLEIVVAVGWAVGAASTVIQGTSFQLPIMYIFLSTIEYYLRVEPYSNPLMEEKDAP